MSDFSNSFPIEQMTDQMIEVHSVMALGLPGQPFAQYAWRLSENICSRHNPPISVLCVRRRALGHVSGQAAVEAVLVHLSAHCRWLTIPPAAAASARAETAGGPAAPAAGRGAGCVGSNARDSCAGGVEGTAAAAEVAGACGPARECTQLLAQRAFGELAAAAAAGASRGLVFVRCQPLLLHLAKVDGRPLAHRVHF